jgi:V/A-type H+-transporting ATPase subunit I
MIVPMQKYSFLVYHRQYAEFLEAIREIGVLHVIEKQEGAAENDALNEQLQLLNRTRSAQRALKNYTKESSDLVSTSPYTDSAEVLADVEDRLVKIESLQQQLQQTDREWERMEVWGRFSPELISKLANSGYQLYFYSCNLRKFDQEWEAKYSVFEIDTVGTIRYFVVLATNGVEPDIDADPVKLSDRDASKIAEEKESIRRQINDEKKALQVVAPAALKGLEQYQREVNGQLDFSRVMLNTHKEADDKVMLLEGWCPVETAADLNNYLDTTGAYYEASEPSAEESVPVKLKNNKFTKMYEVIGELYDMPNYREIDLTPFFAPFFMLFFGISLGDAAYGLLIVLVALLLRRKAKPTMKPVFSLAAWLGVSTVVMGIVSGTFMGFNLIEADIAWLEKFKVIMLNPDQLFNTALILGAVQILFGMIIRAVGSVIRYGVGASLSHLGWLLVILGGGGTYLISSMTIMDPKLQQHLYYGFFGAGALMVFVLNNLKRNPLINIGAGLWDTYNMATGLLGDLLSYIRLFALGISSAVMGFVFNDLAISLSGNIPVISTILMLLIMVFGHSINIFMGGLGAFVHPMRLTFVEFYKNAGFEGGGKKYKPFKSVQSQ